MHKAQRTDAVRALDGPLLRIYPAVVAVRRTSQAQLESGDADYKEGLRLAAAELLAFHDSPPMRVLRFVLRDAAASTSDLPGAVLTFQRELTALAEGATLDPRVVESAWQSFKTALGKIEVLIDEVPVGSRFDPKRHDAVAGSTGSNNDRIMETLSPGLAAHGVRVAWARVRTGPGHVA